MLGTGARLSTHVLLPCPLSLPTCHVPSWPQSPCRAQLQPVARGCSPWAQCGLQKRRSRGSGSCQTPTDQGSGLAPPGSARNGGAVLGVCMSVPSFGKGRRAHGNAALSCACQGQGLMLVAELWHPPRCHAPEQLLPSVQSKGTWARASHMPPLSQLWAQLCPTFTEVVRDQLWVCSGGSLAHGSPLHPAISRRCPCCAAASRRNTLTGHLSSRHHHRGAANRAYAVIYCCHGNDHTVTC